LDLPQERHAMSVDPTQVYSVPSSEVTTRPQRSTGLDRWALGRLHGAAQPARVRFVLWDGAALGPPEGIPVASVHIRNRRALYGWLRDPELNFGEAYMFGGVDVEGDIAALLEEVYRQSDAANPRRWRFGRRVNDLDAARHNVHHHYDLGNAFYRLWLDAELVYTCACFPTPDATLEEAQIAKMDLVCRKLQLRPGDRVVEAGCGWGALAIYMARHYGVQVRAYNCSREQIAHARARAASEGLQDRVTFVEDDYRNIDGTADVFVSVGMLEHVGVADYPTLGRLLDRTLTPDGRAFLHFIGRNQALPLNAWIRKRIFPGAYPPTLREVCEGVLEPQGFSLLDVENLRLHYALTLDHWRRRFEDAVDEVRARFDEPFVRAWRLYLAGSQASFRTGALQLFQIVFARGASNTIPWRRLSA
jgi:cyclopropane-fatty-acyl-phospholipid synthase